MNSSRPTCVKSVGKVYMVHGQDHIGYSPCQNGVATLVYSSGVPLKQGTSVAQLKPFLRREVSETVGGTSEEDTLVVAGVACIVVPDHDYIAQPNKDVPSIVSHIGAARQWVGSEN